MYELPQYRAGSEPRQYSAARRRRVRPASGNWFRNLPGTQPFGRFDPEGSTCETSLSGVTVTAADYSLQLAATVTRSVGSGEFQSVHVGRCDSPERGGRVATGGRQGTETPSRVRGVAGSEAVMSFSLSGHEHQVSRLVLERNTARLEYRSRCRSGFDSSSAGPTPHRSRPAAPSSQAGHPRRCALL